MARVVWTDELRSLLAPRNAAQLAPLDLDKLWSRVRAGLDKETQRLRALLEAKDLPRDAPLEELSLAVSMAAPQLSLADALVVAIGATWGPAAATAALIGGHRHRASSKTASWIGADEPFAWAGLRSVTLRHGEADALATVRAVWSGVSLPIKIALGHAFPGAPDLAADVAREVAALPSNARVRIAPVLASLRDPTHLLGALSRRKGAYPLVDAVENMGLDALPTFLALWRQPIADRPHLARATRCYEDEAVAKIFAGELDKITARQAAREYFLHFPALAQQALGRGVKRRSARAALATELIARATAPDAREEAPMSALPEVIASPPWMRAQKTKRTSRVVDVPMNGREETLCWSSSAREAVRRTTGGIGFPELAADKATAYAAQIKANSALLAWWVGRERIPLATLLEVIDERGFEKATRTYFPFQALAVFGDRVLPRFIEWFVEHVGAAIRQTATYRLEDIVDSHRIAIAMLDFERNSPFSQQSFRYWQLHTEATVVGLVPLAIGRRGAPVGCRARDSTPGEATSRDRQGRRGGSWAARVGERGGDPLVRRTERLSTCSTQNAAHLAARDVYPSTLEGRSRAPAPSGRAHRPHARLLLARATVRGFRGRERGV
jgi:hypothetical protein